jgi:uncharacterized protein YgbK (DUF1537 family)
VILGCIADDFTGATDLANTLVRKRHALRADDRHTERRSAESDAERVVIALKSRTRAARRRGFALSSTRCAGCRRQGARQIYFKYCSTFDSTREGNIGPVAEALIDALEPAKGAGFTIATPAFPDNRRNGVQGPPLRRRRAPERKRNAESPRSPPMTDPTLVRVLQAQCRGKVGLIDYSIVARGEVAIRQRIEELRAGGVRNRDRRCRRQ